MTFPDIVQRKPNCDISRNVQAMTANFKAKKHSVKTGVTKNLFGNFGFSGWLSKYES